MNDHISPNLVNAQPLRVKESPSHEESSKESFDTPPCTSCFSSTGTIIFCENNTGEVLTQESFDDTGLHFMFTKTTNIQHSPNYDYIGIGSVVLIYWSRSFERVVRGSHIIVQIEKMEVYQCSTFIKEQVFITFNSQSTAGVAIGVTERNMNVAFHPNCFSGIRYETLKALNESRTEFQLTCNYKYRENTNRMVEVILASVPFRIEISGSIEKVPFFVIKKCGDLLGCEGKATITKVVKNIFMEACFLESSEVVFFDSNSCHSNILLDNTGIQQLLDQAHQKTASSEDNTFLKHRASRRLGGQRSLTLFGVDWTGAVLPISGPGARPVPRQIRSLTKCCSSTSPRRDANATAAAADSADVVVNCMTLGHHRSWSTSNGRYAIITCLSVASSSALGFVIQQHHRRSAREDRQLLGEMLRRESYK
uniref:Uncharacterized protein n=1 Tax=Caenorhabditis japonica TaxID=281687 RepID=A0A8R1EA09_CAEJA